MRGVSRPGSKSTSKRSTAAAARDVVILRESEVADISSAIRAVRADAATARSQILIIAAESDNGAADSEDVRLASAAVRIRAMAATAAVKGVAERLAPLVADLEQLLGESEREAAGLAEDIGEGTRARLQHRTRVLEEIGSWIREVANDLSQQVQTTGEGRRPVDLVDLWHQAQAELGEEFGVRFVLEPADAALPRPEVEVAGTLDLLVGCARLVAARIGNAGTARVQMAAAPTAVTLSLTGLGSGQPVRCRRLVERVRELAEGLGVRMTAGAGGPNGASLELAFPRPAA